MNIYLVSQTVNHDWDTYDSFVCYAETEDDARFMSPDQFYKWIDGGWHFCFSSGIKHREDNWAWCQPDDVKVKLIGSTTDDVESGVILASFNAG